MTATTKIAINIGLANKHRKYYLPTDLTVNHAIAIAEREDAQLCEEVQRGAVAVTINGELVEDYHDMPLVHGQIITLVHRH